MRTKWRDQPEKIHLAFELLNEAAREKKQELSDVLEDRYAHVQRLMSEMSLRFRRRARFAKRRTEAILHAGERRLEHTARKTVRKVDRNIHDHPWAFLAGIAVGGFLLGLGYRSNFKKKNGDHAE